MVTGAYSDRFVKNCEPWNTPKEWFLSRKRVKKWGDVTFMKEWVKALDKTRILAPADIRFVVSFPRYGRLKLEFVLEQIN